MEEENNLMQVQPGAAPVIKQKNKFIAEGDGCIQAGQVDKIEVNVQGLSGEQLALLLQLQGLASQQQSAVKHCTRNELFELSHQNYHLFVLEKEFYDKEVFSVSNEVTFTYTSKELWERYFRIDSAAQQELINMPAILATKNRGQGRTDGSHAFQLAKIDKITNQGKIFRIEFRTDGQDRKQQSLNEHCKELGFAYSPELTELDKVHWAIKEGDLLGILDELGI